MCNPVNRSQNHKESRAIARCRQISLVRVSRMQLYGDFAPQPAGGRPVRHRQVTEWPVRLMEIMANRFLLYHPLQTEAM